MTHLECAPRLLDAVYGQVGGTAPQQVCQHTHKTHVAHNTCRPVHTGNPRSTKIEPRLWPAHLECAPGLLVMPVLTQVMLL
jgi:hypothetical protein